MAATREMRERTMAKSSSTPAAGTASQTPAAAPAAAQGAASALPSAPGAGSQAGTTTPPRAPRLDPTRPAPEVREDDGLAGLSAIAAQLAGLEGPGTDDPAPRKTAKAKLTPPADIDDDDDEDAGDLDEAARGQAEPPSDNSTGAAPADAFDPDAPVLGEDEDDADGEVTGADDTDGAAEQDDDSSPQAAKLKADNFKLREARRKLKADLEAAQKQIEDLEGKLATVPKAASATPAFDGYFAQVTKAEDVDQIEATLQADLDYLEDNADGYTYTDANGIEKVVTRQEVREWKRKLQAQLREAPKVREVLQKHAQRAQEADTLAKKKYPWVFDPKAKLNERVLDAAKEFPELTRSPARALALGRLAIGKLVESGEYVLVKRTAAASRSAAPSAKPAPAPPPPIAGRNGHRQSAPQDDLGERIARGDRDAMEAAALALITKSK